MYHLWLKIINYKDVLFSNSFVTFSEGVLLQKHTGVVLWYDDGSDDNTMVYGMQYDSYIAW